jgi:predicted membrane-bound mannosyltransferase
MILLAGFGAVALLDSLRQPVLKMAISALLLLGAAQLAFQAWRAGVEFAADPRNPYVYAQTSQDILNLVNRVDALAQADPQKYSMVVKLIAPESDYWPLPWYLRRFNQVGYWSQIPPDPYAPVMIVSTKFDANLDANKTHLMAGIFELRPQTFLELYAETNLWRVHLAAAKPSD